MGEEDTKRQAQKVESNDYLFKLPTQADIIEGTKDLLSKIKTGLEKPETFNDKFATLPEGEIQKELKKKLTEIPTEKLTENRKKLGDSKLKEIFSNNNLLSKIGENDLEKAKNIKEETLYRVATYTKQNPKTATELENQWLELDYLTVGGQKQENNVGLAEVLIDPDIKFVMVKKGSKLILGHRIDGERGFYDTNNQYIATFTGDKFKIMDNTSTDFNDPEARKTYLAKAETDREIRSKFIEDHKEYTSIGTKYIHTTLGTLEREAADKNTESPELLQRARITKEMVEEGATISKKVNDVKSYEVLEKQNRPLYMMINEVCRHYRVPRAFMYAIAHTESNFTGGQITGDKHLEGGSVGITQFRPGTWTEITKKKAYTSFMETYYPGKTFDRGENILAGLAAAATLINIHAEQGGINLNKATLTNAEIVYLRARYKGAAAKSLSEKAREGTIGEPYAKFVRKYRSYELGEEALKKAAEEEKSPQTLIRLDGDDQVGIFGSSSAIGISGVTEHKIYGVKGYNSKNFLTHLEGNWEEIKDKVPKTVILLGLMLNGLDRDSDDNLRVVKNAESRIKSYMELVKFLESKGIKVKIAAGQPYKGKIKGIIAFNKILKRDYPQYYIESGSKSEELHPPRTEYKKIVEVIDRHLAT